MNLGMKKKTSASTPIEVRNEKLAQKVIKELESRHFEAYYCATKEEALTKALELTPEGSKVSWGGSSTLAEIGLKEKLHQGNYEVLDRDIASTPEEKDRIAHEAFFSDYYFLSANAISEDGQIINIDGTGNRVAAMIYGPKNVIVIAGMNKMAKTVEDAMARARMSAAPVNAQRFDIKTPCKVNGSCANCKSPDSICAYFTVTRISRPSKKIKVILVGENLGY